MCKMYGIIKDLCTEKGIKPGKMCADLGISRGIIGDLKAGRTKQLSTDKVAKIAAYFNVSTDYLLGHVSEPFFILDNERILAEINDTGDNSNTTPTQPGKRCIECMDTVCDRNIIRIAGRDGSFEERTLSDDQLSALKAILNQMPDASDDL